jgi:hypothetical protein
LHRDRRACLRRAMFVSHRGARVRWDVLHEVHGEREPPVRGGLRGHVLWLLCPATSAVRLRGGMCRGLLPGLQRIVRSRSRPGFVQERVPDALRHDLLCPM